MCGYNPSVNRVKSKAGKVVMDGCGTMELARHFLFDKATIVGLVSFHDVGAISESYSVKGDVNATIDRAKSCGGFRCASTLLKLYRKVASGDSRGIYVDSRMKDRLASRKAVHPATWLSPIEAS